MESAVVLTACLKFTHLKEKVPCDDHRVIFRALPKSRNSTRRLFAARLELRIAFPPPKSNTLLPFLTEQFCTADLFYNTDKVPSSAAASTGDARLLFLIHLSDTLRD